MGRSLDNQGGGKVDPQVARLMLHPPSTTIRGRIQIRPPADGRPMTTRSNADPWRP